MSVLSLITARKGSKGLKDKNVLLINNKYVFEHSIDYSNELSEKIEGLVTVVSSDSEIAEGFCEQHSVRFIKRKPELCLDETRIEDVIYDTVCNVGGEFKYISLLYANIPLRYPDEFLKAYRFLEENPDYDAVLSMQKVEKHNPAWMFDLNMDVVPDKEVTGHRRQDLKELMIHDGHTILIRSEYFLKFMQENRDEVIMYKHFGKKIKPMLNNKLIIDIDTSKDLDVVRAILGGEVSL